MILLNLILSLIWIDQVIFNSPLCTDHYSGQKMQFFPIKPISFTVSIQMLCYSVTSTVLEKKKI